MSAASRLVLATDLDGTFAHGDVAAREEVVGLLGAHPHATLVYVTGRTVPAAQDLVERAGLPPPAVLIADVGTSVLVGLGPQRVQAIEAELERSWPGAEPVRDRLGSLGGDLVPQDVHAPRRMSYWVEPVRRLTEASEPRGDAFEARTPDDPSLSAEAAGLARDVAARAGARLEGMNVDVLLSANVFLDVLPRRVNKGSTLRRVLAWLGAAEEHCVVAGDSLNDVALFETGLRGIAVGNCEPALRERVAGMSRVYLARGEGAAGVLEGLRHHGHFRKGGEGGEQDGE